MIEKLLKKMKEYEDLSSINKKSIDHVAKSIMGEEDEDEDEMEDKKEDKKKKGMTPEAKIEIELMLSSAKKKKSK